MKRLDRVCRILLTLKGNMEDLFDLQVTSYYPGSHVNEYEYYKKATNITKPLKVIKTPPH
jgi:hypothetical protein